MTSTAATSTWPTTRLAWLFEQASSRGHDNERVLSVYRDHGVVPKDSRTDNFNRTPEDLSNYQLVQPGDLVVNRMKAWQGSLGISEYRGVVSPDYEVLRPIDFTHDYRFLHRLLRSQVLIDQYALRSTGIRPSQWRLYWDDMKTIEVALPGLAEQQAIADYLDHETARIDTLIEEQQRLIEMLRERRNAVIAYSLAPKASWLRRRVKHLGTTALGKMLDSGRAAREGDKLNPYVRAADVRADGSVNLVDLNEMPFSADEMASFDLRAGDILLIEGGATVGRPGFVFEPAPGIAFQKTVNRLRVDETAYPRFVYWLMLRLYQTDYYANHYGSVSFVHLTGEKLREIELSLPPIEEQRHIATYLDDQTGKIDSLIAEAERFIEISKERRSALIASAVTGQIEVRE